MNILQNSASPRNHRNNLHQRGTTLIELMIALALFLIVGGTAFTLFNQQQAATVSQYGQVGLTLALRNTGSQLQRDLANAGNGYFQGINVPAWPVGVTIMNNWIAPGSTLCHDSSTTNTNYSQYCFDQINIITADPDHYPAVNVTDVTGVANPAACPTWSTSAGSPGSPTTIYVQAAPVSQAFPSGLSLSATAAKFSAGDQLLFVKNNGSLMTTAVIQSVGNPAAAIPIVIYQTQSDGSNIHSADTLDITTCARTTTASGTCPPTTVPVTPSYFTTSFCAGDWVIKLSPIKYAVVQNPDPVAVLTNPWQLVRTQNGVSTVVMDQIIGFKAGAAIWNDVQTGSGFSSPIPANVPYYNYNAALYAIAGSPSVAEGYNFSLVRSVRVSILARSTPNAARSNYHNTFDGGAYQVQGTAIVVNPRNLSMNDDQNQALQ